MKEWIKDILEKNFQMVSIDAYQQIMEDMLDEKKKRLELQKALTRLSMSIKSNTADLQAANKVWGVKND